ncbi:MULTISPECIES: aspartyl-phosphate phosphatase Spo0E family protein [Paenibacillus]|uniref:aspartyl-phosphate phosphatase Spo0E family protein n=1 Tax=Paenibacillus TaxID=44249 RepID=UPI002FE2DC2E
MPTPSSNGSNPNLRRPRVSAELLDKIEHLRAELMHVADQTNFSSEAVVELSQRLDHYIVLAQTQMLGRINDPGIPQE